MTARTIRLPAVQRLLRHSNGGSLFSAWQQILSRAYELSPYGVLDEHQICGAVHQQMTDTRTIRRTIDLLAGESLIRRLPGGKFQLPNIDVEVGIQPREQPCKDSVVSVAMLAGSVQEAQKEADRSFDERRILPMNTTDSAVSGAKKPTSDILIGDQTAQPPMLPKIEHSEVEPTPDVCKKTFTAAPALEKPKEKNQQQPKVADPPAAVKTSEPKQPKVVDQPARENAARARPGYLTAVDCIQMCRSKGYISNMPMTDQNENALGWEKVAPVSSLEIQVAERALAKARVKARAEPGTRVIKAAAYMLGVIRKVREQAADAEHPRNSDAPGRPQKKIEPREPQKDAMSLAAIAAQIIQAPPPPAQSPGVDSPVKPPERPAPAECWVASATAVKQAAASFWGRVDAAGN